MNTANMGTPRDTTMLALLVAMALTPTPPVARLLDALNGRDVKERGTYWIARCPAHEDDKHSLSIAVGKKDGRAVVKCHAGCDVEAIARGAGLTVVDLFPETTRTAGALALAPDPKARGYLAKTYDYVDEQESLLYQVCRYEPKGFNQRRRGASGEWIYSLGDVRRVLYRLPELIQGVAEGRTVYLVEGEKDVETLTALGYCATTWACGASAWQDEYAIVFRGGTVVCLPDNDDGGKAAMQKAARAITELGGRVRVVELPAQPPKGDVTDWLNAGHDLDEFAALEAAAPIWLLDPANRTRWRLDDLWETDSVMRPPMPVVPRLAWGGRCTLLAAREKSGKSTLTGHVAAQVSSGGQFLGDRCQAGTVLIIGLEEFIGDAARRLRHFGADATRVYLVDRFHGDPKQRTREIRTHVDLVKPVLVIVDSLSAFSNGQIQDDNNATQMASVVQPLTDLAHETGIALIIVHHARKSDGRARGSTAITAAADVVCEFFPPNEDTDPTLRRMRSAGRVPVPAFYDFRFDGETYLLENREVPLEQRIMECVRGHPGTSVNSVVELLAARKFDVLNIVTHMLANGSLKDMGKGSRARKLYVPGSLSGEML